jgi:hypothetical protein
MGTRPVMHRDQTEGCWALDPSCTAIRPRAAGHSTRPAPRSDRRLVGTRPVMHRDQTEDWWALDPSCTTIRPRTAGHSTRHAPRSDPGLVGTRHGPHHDQTEGCWALDRPALRADPRSSADRLVSTREHSPDPWATIPDFSRLQTRWGPGGAAPLPQVLSRIPDAGTDPRHEAWRSEAQVIPRIHEIPGVRLR